MLIILRDRLIFQILIIFSLLVITVLLFHLPVYSQESQQKILLFDFEMTVGNQRYKKLEQELTKQMKNFMNQSMEANIHVQRFEEIRKKYFPTLILPEPILGFLSDDDLRLISNSPNFDFNYILVGRFLEKSGIVRAEIHLIDCQTGKIICSFSESEADIDESKTIQESLSEKFTRDIEMHLMGRIRIGLIDFKMTGGNSDFRFLGESIPTMLASGLSVSRKFKLIEKKSEDILIEIREKGSRGIFNESTMLEVGRKMNANYIITGEFWEYKDKIRIDARCVNIETGEIILSEGINLDIIDINNISGNIKVLASKIRFMIEKDFMQREKVIKSIAVISFPPSPNNRKNKLMAGHIRRALVRKLRVTPDLRVKDDPKKINKYLDIKEDKLKICSDLEVSSLLAIQYEELYEDSIILDVDLYDIEEPTQEIFTATEKTKYKELDGPINEVVLKTLKGLRINKLDDEKIKEIETIQVPTLSTRWTIGGMYSLVNRAGRELFPLKNLGDYFELSLGYKLSNRMKVELEAGIDIGSRERILQSEYNDKLHVSCMHFSLPLKYNLIKTSPFDVYVGLGVSVFQIYRNIVRENAGIIDSRDAFGAGLMTLFGIEVKLKKVGITFYLEPRYILGTEVEATTTTITYDPKTYEYTYPGGRLGGFYFSLGIGYNFNF